MSDRETLAELKRALDELDRFPIDEVRFHGDPEFTETNQKYWEAHDLVGALQLNAGIEGIYNSRELREHIAKIEAGLEADQISR